MKKNFLFIGIPCIILIFAILNAIMLFKPTTNYPYKFNKEDYFFEIRIVDDIYFIKSTQNSNTELVDFGHLNKNGNKITFSSDKNSQNPNIKLNGIFSLSYEGNTFYCATAIVLEVIYSLFICAGLVALIITFIKYKN